VALSVSTSAKISPLLMVSPTLNPFSNYALSHGITHFGHFYRYSHIFLLMFANLINKQQSNKRKKRD
jgi:hypothetical protein